MEATYPTLSGPFWYAMATIGAFTTFCIVSLAAYGLIAAALRSMRGWFTKPAPKDIPDFIAGTIVCTCPRIDGFIQRTNPKCPLHGLNGNRNHTNTLSISEFKAVRSNHPCTSKAPERRESEQPRRSGGGDTREGA